MGALVGLSEAWPADAPAEFGICAEAIVAIVDALVIGSLYGLIATL